MYVFSQEGVHYSKLYAGSPKVRFILLITLMSFCLSNVNQTKAVIKETQIKRKYELELMKKLGN